MEKARKEIEIIQQYLPEQLTEDELEAIIKDAILETGAQSAKDMGKIMKVVIPRVKGRSDGVGQSNKGIIITTKPGKTPGFTYLL